MATINVLHAVAVVSSLLSLLILLIALGSDYWATANVVSQGLWNVCISSTCAKLTITSELMAEVKHLGLSSNRTHKVIIFDERCEKALLEDWMERSYTTRTVKALLNAPLNATRAFILLAMIASVVACCCLCAIFWLKQVGSISMAMMAATANIVAGLFTMIGMSIFTGNVDQFVHFGWSFGLGWACFPLFLICGVIAYKLKMDTSA